jgi:hypothetical protein
MKKSLACLMLSFCILIAAKAQHHDNNLPNNALGNWRLLGSVSAGHSGDHDVINVTGPSDYYRKLKFKVTNSPLTMNKMVVTYDDHGAPENIDTRTDIPKGGESREIDLKGGKRKIRNVQFWFDTKGFLNGKAEVTLFGLK